MNRAIMKLRRPNGPRFRSNRTRLQTVENAKTNPLYPHDYCIFMERDDVSEVMFQDLRARRRRLASVPHAGRKIKERPARRPPFSRPSERKEERCESKPTRGGLFGFAP